MPIYEVLDERRNDVCGHVARLTTTPNWRNEIVA
jgi:hypothetical protein